MAHQTWNNIVSGDTNPTYLHQYTIALRSKFQDSITPPFSQFPPQRPPAIR